jgi:ribose-phosphate pyrophosphokinase
MSRLSDCALDRVVATDTIRLSKDKARHPKIVVLEVASLLGEAIARIHSNASVSSLFV